MAWLAWFEKTNWELIEKKRKTESEVVDNVQPDQSEKKKKTEDKLWQPDNEEISDMDLLNIEL